MTNESNNDEDEGKIDPCCSPAGADTTRRVDVNNSTGRRTSHKTSKSFDLKSLFSISEGL